MKSTEKSNSKLALSNHSISLNNPVLAGVLSWLVPGLGHYYQGRKAKGTLFFLCIVPMFLLGCFFGSSSEVGLVRDVYYSWRHQDKRLFFIPQACIGLAAIPAGIQAMRVGDGKPPIFGSFMAPPKLDNGDATGVAPTLTEITRNLSFWFEIGTYLTVIAGLMNILVIFDAIDGPIESRKEE